MTPVNNVCSLPQYNLHRVVKDAADGVSITEEARAMNAGGFDRVAVQVVPSSGANPTIEVLFWSKEAAKFISAHVPITYAGKGADTPYEFTLDALMRKFFVRVTGGMAGGQVAKIFVGGSPNTLR